MNKLTNTHSSRSSLSNLWQFCQKTATQVNHWLLTLDVLTTTTKLL